MSNTTASEVLIVGGGIAGICTALEVLSTGKKVLIVDRDSEAALGGLAREAFGGMALCGTPQQRLNGIDDSPELMRRDWYSFADFSEQDHWPRFWAENYCQRNLEDVHRWLTTQGVGFFPAVNWVERGEFRPGNTVPRYHMVWGTGMRLVDQLIGSLRTHRKSANLQFLFQHRVDELVKSAGQVVGVSGVNEVTGSPFEIRSEIIVVASGGINGNLEKVRQHWPRHWGTPPVTILNGSHRFSDGRLHDAVETIGGTITHLDWQWNYAAGISHPEPKMPLHGLSLIPPKSALWMDAQGRRIGPHPLVTGFDTHGLCERISNTPHGYSWQILNRRIALKEISISGSEHNPAFRDRRIVKFLKEILLGNSGLYEYLINECPDIVTANSLEELAAKMNAMDPDVAVDTVGMMQDIQEYDRQIERGLAFHDDDQLRRIAHARSWKGDRVRTLKHQKIDDRTAYPLVAIREFIISRKSMGGIQTDDHCRVLDHLGNPIGGLFAVGEAAGFGGGGAMGNRSLEGTFLSLCILTGRIAGRSISGVHNP